MREEKTNLTLEEVLRGLVVGIINKEVNSMTLTTQSELNVGYNTIVGTVDSSTFNNTGSYTRVIANGGTFDVEKAATTGEFKVYSEGSEVFLSFTDGKSPFISQANELSVYSLITEDEITFAAPSIQINGNDFGGLVRINDLTNKLNALVNEIIALKAYINTHTHLVPLPTPASPTASYVPLAPSANQFSYFSASDYENNTVSHGNTTSE